MNDLSFKNSPDGKEAIQRLANAMAQLPQLEVETQHFYADEMYARKIVRPAGSVLIGRTHRKVHFYIVVTGKCVVSDGEKSHEYTAGDIIVSQPGSKKATCVTEDSVLITVHHTKKKNLKKIERELIDEDDVCLFDAQNKLVHKQLEHDS
jgi:quercetin dioxygenase-like cupin family protein